VKGFRGSFGKAIPTSSHHSSQFLDPKIPPCHAHTHIAKHHARMDINMPSLSMHPKAFSHTCGPTFGMRPDSGIPCLPSLMPPLLYCRATSQSVLS
jgi:hypothetical protein